MTEALGGYEPGAARAETRGQREPWRGATVVDIEPGGPADREGLEVGMVVTHVNGVELRDMIDWQWEADGPSVHLEGVAYAGTPEEFEFECDLERDWGEDWGVVFDGAVFDGMRLCRNNCTFCFMKMLPKGMRRTLYMRDDDYRLSFLQGNFVTLTNVSDEDVERIITCALSPLNVSLHAVTPEVRRSLMGKNAQRGMDALLELLAADVEIHAQVVLVPDQNDGEELRRTLDFVVDHPAITSLGIVPLGFTKHQDTFSASFNEPDRARAVIEMVRPYQVRNRAADGRTRFQLADEFYLAAQVDPPVAEEYDGYPQYQDGVGMVRSYLDEIDDVVANPEICANLSFCAESMRSRGEQLLLVSGTGAALVVERFLGCTPLAEVARVAPIANEYFGGNVNVTGLLTAEDVLAQLPQNLSSTVVLLPDIMLNADRLTLDGSSAEELCALLERRGARARFARGTPVGIVQAMGELWP